MEVGVVLPGLRCPSILGYGQDAWIGHIFGMALGGYEFGPEIPLRTHNKAAVVGVRIIVVHLL